MEFRILGPLAVEDDGREIALGGARPRTLLTILLLHRDQVVHADRLIEDLYRGDPPPAAAKALRAHVSRLRRALGPPGALHTRAGGYVLELEPGTLDAERFEDLLARGKSQRAAGHHDEAATILREALALWRGPPLADVAYEAFAQSEIARLDELRLAALEERTEADLYLGRHGDIVGELELLVREHPLRERLRSQLMLALYRSDRQAEALDAYQEGRRLLSGELGLDPGRALRELERAILRQDATLDPPTTRDEDFRVPPATVFVGRERELGELRTCLGDALAGRGRLVLIAGEPGIGKSRLAEELSSEARRRGARVLGGRCWEAGGAPAYWPWVQSLRTYIRDCDPEVLRVQLGAGAADLAQLFLELREHFPDLPTAASPESEGARFRLFDAAAAFLKNAARAQPLVLVLDDLHAADEPSLLLLRFVARELGDARLLVICAYRDADPSLRDPLRSTLSELGREPATHRVALDGLGEADVAEYIAGAAGIQAGTETVAEIHAETDGNPLFVSELVRLLAAEGRLGDSEWPLGLPSSVREVIGSRMRRLSEQCRCVLTLASVLGREFELDALGRLSELSRDELLDVLDEAMVERVVAEAPDAPGQLRFAHALIRDALYDDLTVARRMQLHREAGGALEHVHAADLGPHLAEIALHFVAAAPGGTADKAIEYTRRAGERAVSLLAYEEAGRLYELALTLVDDAAARCDVLLALGDAQARAGDTRASRQSYRQAAELADELESPEQLAQAALGYGGRLVWDVMRDDAYAVPLFERALEAIGSDETPSRVRLLARLAAGPLRDARFPPARRAAASREALEIARRIGDPSTLAYALAGYVEANLTPDSILEQLEVAGELIEVALAAGELERAHEGHQERMLDLLSLGDRHGAEAELDAMAAIAEQLRQPAQEWIVAVHRAVFALLDGELALAEELIASGRALGERTQSWNAAVSSGLQLYVLRRFQGRLAEIEDLIRDSAARYPTYTIWRCVLAQTAGQLGHDAEAQEAFDELAADGFAALTFDDQWLVAMTLLADTAVGLGDRARAYQVYDRLLPYAERVAVCYPEIGTGPVARNLGLLAATTERMDEAERHFETALETSGRLGDRPWLALTRRDFGTMLRARGSPADRRRADELLRAARELADEIGMSLSA